MKLEVGKRYRTRDNQIVTITEFNTEVNSTYHFGGIVGNDNETFGWWREDGSFHDFPCALDIIEEVKEQPMLLPFDPSKKAEVTTETGDAVILISNKPDSNGRFVVLDVATMQYKLLTKENLRLKPLTLINGKPVFIGDEIVVYGVSANIKSYDSMTRTIHTQQQVSIIGLTGLYDEFHISQVSPPKKMKYINLYKADNFANDIEGHWHDSEQEAMNAVVAGHDYIGTILVNVMNTSKDGEYVKLY